MPLLLWEGVSNGSGRAVILPPATPDPLPLMNTPAPTREQIEGHATKLASSDEKLGKNPSFRLGVCETLLLESYDLLDRWRNAADEAELAELAFLTEEHFRRFSR